MKKSIKNEYKIELGQVTNNGLHLLAAQWNMNFNQVITLALDDYLRKKLKHGEYSALDDDECTNYMIGETINSNRGVFGYNPDFNDPSYTWNVHCIVLEGYALDKKVEGYVWFDDLLIGHYKTSGDWESAEQMLETGKSTVYTFIKNASEYHY